MKFEDKVIVVTGGTGSFGNEVATVPPAGCGGAKNI